MLVRAKQKCFVGGSRRRVGETFEFDGAKLPPYLELVPEVVEGAQAPSAPAAPKEIMVAGKVAKVPTRPKDFLNEVL